MRTSLVKNIENPFLFKKQLLIWAQQFREIVFLDSNDYPRQYSSYECLLAVDAFTSVKTDFHNSFDDLRQYQQTTKDWLFGYLSYDLKNDTEDLYSNNFDGLNFPDLYFFQPKKLFLLKGNQLEIQYLNMCDDEIEIDFMAIIEATQPTTNYQQPITIKQRISKEKYIEKVTEILTHIHRGDIYEANFCMEFFVENTEINPLDKFLKLNEISKSPLAVFFKN
ncbi:MAG: chorismate-binding protein, partial [Flavobacterium sp.]|nr:chorismate-binding protein [Flavobacterium sp.]